MKYNKTKSFTLIEMLAVITIIGILASVIFFSTNDAFEKQKKMEVLNFSIGLKNKNLDSLVSEWTFDGPTSAGSAATNSDVKDSWGYNHGDVAGHAPTVREGEDCVSEKCLEFDGDYSYIKVLDSPSLIFNESYTISFWAYNGLGSRSYPTFFNKKNQSGSAGFWWGYTTGTDEKTINWQYANGSTYAVNTWSDFIPNTWSHIAVVFNYELKTTTLYINGKNMGSKESNAKPVLSGDLYIGTYLGFTATNYNFKGKMDEILIYNKFLSVSEIKQNYIAGLDSLLKNRAISKEEYNKRLLNLAKND